MDLRREKVGKLYARGMTTRDIAIELSQLPEPILNNGQPFSHVTIASDVNAIRRQWRKNAESELNEHIARQFGEIQEAKRVAWENNDLKTFAQLIAIEIKLLGTDTPQKLELTGKDGNPLTVTLVKGYTIVSPEDFPALDATESKPE